MANRRDGLSILIESFAFAWVPTDADFVFDARALLNPYWQADIRSMTGLDAPVKQFLESDERCLAFYGKLSTFIKQMLHDFSQVDKAILRLQSAALADNTGRFISPKSCMKT